MSMTKRLIDSLSKKEQEEILGLPCDEWTESAANEPMEKEKVELWWARELAEGGDDQC